MNNLIEFFNQDYELKRLKELTKYFKENKALNLKMQELLSLQKEVVNAKYKDLTKYKDLKIKYDNMLEELLEIPFVEEYLDKLGYFNDILKYLKKSIENDIINSLDIEL